MITDYVRAIEKYIPSFIGKKYLMRGFKERKIEVWRIIHIRHQNSRNGHE